METPAIWDWLGPVIIFLLVGLPSIFALRKAGWSGWWSLLFIVPVINILMLWLFAFGRWPNEERTSQIPNNG